MSIGPRLRGRSRRLLLGAGTSGGQQPTDIAQLAGGDSLESAGASSPRSEVFVLARRRMQVVDVHVHVAYVCLGHGQY
ncbi:hypothetical protein pipiens_013023 [Culex pipiens pipiens]|uniref:Uncharacterized protein n=1 Tax=Culex pipiens pipiens TaxID=38569 RepID=A0ABD1D2Q3_CULPP